MLKRVAACRWFHSIRRLCTYKSYGLVRHALVTVAMPETWGAASGYRAACCHNVCGAGGLSTSR